MHSKSRTARKPATKFVAPVAKFYVFKQIGSEPVKYAIFHKGGVVYTQDVALATQFAAQWEAQAKAKSYNRSETATLLLTPVF